VEDPDLVEWIARQTDWYGHRQVIQVDRHRTVSDNTNRQTVNTV